MRERIVVQARVSGFGILKIWYYAEIGSLMIHCIETLRNCCSDLVPLLQKFYIDSRGSAETVDLI